MQNANEQGSRVDAALVTTSYPSISQPISPINTNKKNEIEQFHTYYELIQLTYGNSGPRSINTTMNLPTT